VDDPIGPEPRSSSGIPIVGILGGVGSGKSLVAEFFRACGAEVLDADAESHAVLSEPEVRAAVRAAFGDGVFDASGSIDRKALGKRVFEDDAALRTLEAIVHPRVRARLDEKLERIRSEDGARLVVLDVPLLLESPFASRCREYVFVEASPSTREARVRAARGWPPGEAARREAKQESLDRKRSQSRFVVRNDGGKDVTFSQVIEVVNALLQEQEPAS
jgi:dephospho-CoA kinase